MKNATQRPSVKCNSKAKVQRLRVRFPAGMPWSCIFCNWSRFGSYNVYLYNNSNFLRITLTFIYWKSNYWLLLIYIYWKSNYFLLIYTESQTESQTFIYWKSNYLLLIYIYILILHRHYHLINILYIYWTRAQVVGNSFCSSVVEHWSSNPEDAGSIPSRKSWELHFSQLVPVWVL